MNWYQMESQEVMDKLNRFKDRGLSVSLQRSLKIL